MQSGYLWIDTAASPRHSGQCGLITGATLQMGLMWNDLQISQVAVL